MNQSVSSTLGIDISKYILASRQNQSPPIFSLPLEEREETKPHIL